MQIISNIQYNGITVGDDHILPTIYVHIYVCKGIPQYVPCNSISHYPALAVAVASQTQ